MMIILGIIIFIVFILFIVLILALALNYSKSEYLTSEDITNIDKGGENNKHLRRSSLNGDDLI